MKPRALAACAAGLLLVAFGVWSGSRAPTLTLVNAALVVAYPAGAPLGRGLAALGFGVLALGLAGRLRLAPLALAALLLFLAVQDGRYELRADEQGLELRGLSGRRRLAWSELERLDTAPRALTAIGPEGRTLELDVSRLQPADRASLERTIARRVREAAFSARPAP